MEERQEVEGIVGAFGDGISGRQTGILVYAIVRFIKTVGCKYSGAC